MILTSPIGRFVFDDLTQFSHAKLVRDTIVGQWLNPKPGTQRLHTELEAQDYIRAGGDVISKVGFDLDVHDEDLKVPPDLEDLPQPPLIPVTPSTWIRQALVGEARPLWLEK